MERVKASLNLMDVHNRNEECDALFLQVVGKCEFAPHKNLQKDFKGVKESLMQFLLQS